MQSLSVAQLVEQLTLNQRVIGSSPIGETHSKVLLHALKVPFCLMTRNIATFQRYGVMKNLKEALNLLKQWLLLLQLPVGFEEQYKHRVARSLE